MITHPRRQKKIATPLTLEVLKTASQVTVTKQISDSWKSDFTGNAKASIKI